MQHSIFFLDGDSHAIKVSFNNDSDALRAAMEKIRECADASNAFYTKAESTQSESLIPKMELILSTNVIEGLGFTFDIYSWENNAPRIAFSDLSGEPIENEDACSLDEVESTSILFDAPKTGNIVIESQCMDDDGNSYAISASMPTDEFLDSMEELARLAEAEDTVLRPGQ